MLMMTTAHSSAREHPSGGVSKLPAVTVNPRHQTADHRDVLRRVVRTTVKMEYSPVIHHVVINMDEPGRLAFYGDHYEGEACPPVRMCSAKSVCGYCAAAPARNAEPNQLGMPVATPAVPQS